MKEEVDVGYHYWKSIVMNVYSILNGGKRVSFKLVSYLGYLKIINMNKDLKATLILLGIIGLITGIYLFGRYASEDAKLYFVLTLFGLMAASLLFAIWKVIRLMID